MADRTCSVGGCERVHVTRGWCEMHYHRWYRRAKAALRPARVQRICSVEGCEKPHKGRGLCDKHLQRLRHRGTTEDKPRAPDECTADGCTRPYWARGWCSTHLQRCRKHGSPDVVEAATGARNSRWLGEAVSYAGAHARVYAARGPASAHACLHCGKAAQEWAYDHTDPDGKTEVRARDGRAPSPVPYSTDPAHYIPLCRTCHLKFDTGRA